MDPNQQQPQYQYQQQAQSQYQQQVYQAAPQVPTKKKVLGYVLGGIGLSFAIVGLIYGFLGPMAFVGAILCLPALILAIIGNKQNKNAVAKAALIISIIGLVVSVVVFVGCIILMAAGAVDGSAFNSYY